MAEQSVAKCDDERPVPPLGYCAECLRGGFWVRAAVMWQGTGFCAQDFIYDVGVAEDAIESARERDIENPTQMVLDTLRRGLRAPARTAGF